MLRSVAVVGGQSLGARIMFADGDDDGPMEIELEDEPLSKALGLTITLNGVPLNIGSTGFDRWWLSGTQVLERALG